MAARKSTTATGRPVDAGLPEPAATPVSEAPHQRPPSLAERLLDGATTGVLALDERGVVRSANAVAVAMVPGLRAGEVLPAGIALDAAAGAAELTVRDRAVAAVARPLPDGWSAWYLDDVTEQRNRLDSLLAERARSRFLATASRRLGLSLHPGRTARTVVELASAGVADTAVVVLAPRRGAVEWYAHSRACGPSAGRANLVDLPEPICAGVRGDAATPQQVLVDDLAGLAGITDTGGGAAAVVTLPGNGIPAGALVLLRGAEGESSADSSPDTSTGALAAVVQEFAQRAGIALAAAALYAQQASTTATLRNALLQPELVEVPGLVFGGGYRPADEGLLIGGDFYDAYSEGMFVLGDVCGKGVDAAVSTGQVRHTLQALRRLERDPVRLLELLNATMLAGPQAGHSPRFASAVLGSAQQQPDGTVRLRMAGGGHPPPLIVRNDGSVEPVEINGMVLGAFPDAVVRAAVVDLAPGEACVLYSDGVIEASGGPDGRSEFGEARLAGLLEGCAVMPAPAIAERILAHTMRWLTGGAHDDIAVLVVQAEPRHLHCVPGGVPGGAVEPV